MEQDKKKAEEGQIFFCSWEIQFLLPLDIWAPGFQAFRRDMDIYFWFPWFFDLGIWTETTSQIVLVLHFKDNKLQDFSASIISWPILS
jgi:hypothetical protein